MKKLIIAIVASSALFAGSATMAGASWTPPVEGGVCVSGNVTTGAPVKYWHKVFMFKPNGAPLLTWDGSQAFFWTCTTTP